MAKRWRLPVTDAASAAALARQIGLPTVVAQLLLNRGMSDPAKISDFLDPSLQSLYDPRLLPGLSEAAERIVGAARAGRRIVIYGDYDADGVTGTAILLKCLSLIGAKVQYYIPDRLEEGYGLNCEALTQIRRQLGADVVVTVDCGVTSVREAEHARQLGLELIITDHHELGQRLPEAACLVHPGRPDGNYPFRGLSGAGVAFKLAWELARQWEGTERVSDRMRNFLIHAVALAALGTVADVVPLRDENRALVRYGLRVIEHEPGLGLSELMRAAELKRGNGLRAEDVAFRLAPRINAAGRLGHARLAVELLVTADQRRAGELANYLNEQNGHRQSIERRIFREAVELLEKRFDPAEHRAIVLGRRGWHVGVIGIVAARLVDRYWRPVMLVSLDGRVAQGSGRSIPGFDMYRALCACADTLLSFGGHQMAAGIRIDPDQLPRFSESFMRVARERIAEEDLAERIEIDAEVPLADVDHKLVHYIEQLGPFGCGNPRPLLMAARVQVVGEPRKVGGGERHLQFRLLQHGVVRRAVAFGMAERADELQRGRYYDVAFRPQINTFGGVSRVDLHVEDFRPCEEP